MADNQKFSFRKEERLCSKKLIDLVFKEGRSFHSFPFKALWKTTPLPMPVPVQVAFMIPKRNVKRAVDRNRVRRQMREIYRHHRHLLTETCTLTNNQVVLVVVYNGKNHLSFAEMESKIILILHRLVETLQADDQ